MKIKYFYNLLLLCLATLLSSSLMAQSCFYTLEMNDSFGDGWNGSVLTITVNGVSTDYTLDNVNDDGIFLAVPFEVATGDIISLDYLAGAWQTEVSYVILDSDGNSFFADGPTPATGTEIFSGTASCPTCPSVLGSSVVITDVNAFNAEVEWNSSSVAQNYIIEIGPAGFPQGFGNIINYTSNEVVLSGLEEDTDYEFYLSVDCGGGDTSNVVGPYMFTTLFAIDVGIEGFITPSPNGECSLGTNEMVEVNLKNFGANPQSLIPFRYSVNGVTANINIPVDGFYTGVLSTDSLASIIFEATANLDIVGPITVEAWTELEGDTNTANDTASFTFVTTNVFPLVEDFEGGVLPENWTTSAFNPIGDGHNAGSFVAFANLYSGITEFNITTSNYGFVNAGDEITFDYRYTDWSAGEVGSILAGDELNVQVSTDCGETFSTIYTIDQNNHVTSADYATATASLAGYEGESVTIRFFATWASGDYWLDLDNINILSCPADFNVNLDVQDVVNGDDGSIVVTPNFGTMPYTYEWSTGETTNSLENLAAGTYTLTITDFYDCQDIIVADVNEVVSNVELDFINKINLAPNPTRDMAVLSIELSESQDISIQLMSTVGQILTEEFRPNTLEANFEFDLNDYPQGMYFVRITNGEKMHVEKLMVVK